MSAANPSGDPRLDPDFLRKHGREVTGFAKPPKGKAHPVKVYALGADMEIRTKALTQFLIVGKINGKPVVLFRATSLEKATAIMRGQMRMDEWRWMRVVDQKHREILWLAPGEKELVRWEA